jgi:hypothetical protein
MRRAQKKNRSIPSHRPPLRKAVAWFKPAYVEPQKATAKAKSSQLSRKVEKVLRKLATGYRLSCIKLDKAQMRFELTRPGETITVKVKRSIVEAMFKLKYILKGLYGSIILTTTGRKAALA